MDECQNCGNYYWRKKGRNGHWCKPFDVYEPEVLGGDAFKTVYAMDEESAAEAYAEFSFQNEPRDKVWSVCINGIYFDVRVEPCPEFIAVQKKITAP